MKFLTLILLLFCLSAEAQIKNIFQKELEAEKIDPATVLDPEYGVMVYNRFAPSLGGDSVRMCQGYACQGYIEDFYTNGQLLHKGYYTNGVANFFKNYYPNGQLERDFRAIDVFRGKLATYYEDGKKRTEGVYREGSTLKYEEYFPNGQMFYIEEFDKKQEYFIQNITYKEDGKVQSSLILENPKKLQFVKSEFHPNGNIKEKGTLVYSRTMMDYIKTGTWVVYDETGKKSKEIRFENGVPAGETEF